MKTFKLLLSLSIPIFIANILQTLYQLTDTFWVGRLGKDAVASVSLTYPIIFFIISLGIGLTVAGSILVSHEKGRKNKEGIRLVSTQTMQLIAFVSLILSSVGYFLSPAIISFMSPSQLVYAGAVSYIKISFIGMFFVMMYMAFQSIMRGLGEVKLPMYIVLISVLLNFLFDPLFIFGFGISGKTIISPMGVSGAALSTLFTQLVASLIGITIMIRKNILKISKIDFSLYKKMLKIGVPSSLETSLRSFGMAFLVGIVAKLGTTVLASYGIGIRVFSFVIIPGLAISSATSALVGHSYGEKDYHKAMRILKYSSLLGFVALTLLGIFIFIFSEQIAALFIPNDESAIIMTRTFLRIISLSFGLIGIQMAINGYFRAIKKTYLPMIITFISNYLVRIPIVLIFMTPVMVWYGFLLSILIGALINIIIFYITKRDWSSAI